MITLGTGDNTVEWDTSKLGGLAETTLSIDATRGSDVIGKVMIKMDGQAATQRIDGSNRYYAGSMMNKVPLAAHLVYEQPWYGNTYNPYIPSVGDISYLNSTKHLSESFSTRMTSAIYIRGIDFKLALNNESVKGEWAAQLPITIIQK